MTNGENTEVHRRTEAFLDAESEDARQVQEAINSMKENQARIERGEAVRGGIPIRHMAGLPADPLFGSAHETVLPYGGKSKVGYSEAGADQQEKDDAEGGGTGQRQGSTLVLLGMAGVKGMTSKELGKATGWHHGQSSGVLSTLHMTGHLVRLRARREGQSIYVLPEFIDGREVSARRKNPAVIQAAEPEIRYVERDVPTARKVSAVDATTLQEIRSKVAQSRDKGVLPLKVSTIEWLFGLIDGLQKEG